MSVLIDSNILVGALNPRDSHHERATTALRELWTGRHGTTIGTGHVLDEVLTLLLKKAPHEEVARQVVEWFWGAGENPARMAWLSTGDDILRDAVDLYFLHRSSALSLTDCTLLAHAQHLDARIATMDGALQRVAHALDI